MTLMINILLCQKAVLVSECEKGNTNRQISGKLLIQAHHLAKRVQSRFSCVCDLLLGFQICLEGLHMGQTNSIGRSQAKLRIISQRGQQHWSRCKCEQNGFLAFKKKHHPLNLHSIILSALHFSPTVLGWFVLLSSVLDVCRSSVDVSCLQSWQGLPTITRQGLINYSARPGACLTLMRKW